MKAMVIGAIAYIASLAILTASAYGYATKPESHDYEAWTSTGVHLMINDNGTPNDFEDDWVFDWETNRTFTVEVMD